MKTILHLFILYCSTSMLFAQGILKIESGTQMVVNGSYLVLDNCDFNNQGTFSSGTSTIKFTGDGDVQLSSGNNPIRKVEIQKTVGTKVLLGDEVTITDSLQFSGLYNYIDINNHNLIMGTSATINNASFLNYIITSGIGELVIHDLNQMLFHIGFDDQSMNMIKITQNGIVDTIGIRCLEFAYENGDSGIVLTDAVNTSWAVSENTPGGNDLQINFFWNTSDEPAGFDRNDCGMMHYHDGDWDLPVTNIQIPGGTPTEHTLSGIFDTVGVFAVGGATMINRIQLAFRTFLQGPFNGTMMNDVLRTKNLIPLSEPFTGLGFTHQGRGGGETIDPTVLNVTGNDAIVDWLFVELRGKNNPSTILETKSALIQKDGDIVDLDGISDLGIPVLNDDYFIAIRHRSHLGIRTPSVQSLEEESSTVYDFTTASSQAFGTNPMADLGSGVWGMYGGNATGDGTVRATGPPFINDYSNLLNYLGSPTGILSNVYSRQDINMDGNARATGPPFINDYSKLLNILGAPTNIISEQL